MQTPRRVHDDDVELARQRGVDRVERDGGGIGAALAADELRIGALRPDAELVDGAGPIGVGCRDEHAPSGLPQRRGELPDERRLPRAVHPHDEDDRRPFVGALHHRIAVPGGERLLDAVTQRLVELLLRANEPAAGEVLDVGHQPERRAHAEVGLEKELLQALERARADAAAHGDAHVHEGDVLDPLPERAAWDVFTAPKDASHVCPKSEKSKSSRA